MAYRDAKRIERPIQVVEYRPMGALASGAIVTLFLALCTFMLFQAFTLVRRSQLECVRGGAHACVLVSDYGLFTTHNTFPLDHILRVHVRSHSGKNGTTYSVNLTLTNGINEQISRSGARARAELNRTVIADFLEGRAVSPSTVPLDEPQPVLAGFMGLFSIGFGFLSFLMLGSARLEFDLDRGTIRYTRSRFPLRPVRRSIRAEHVEGARVTARPGSKGGTIYGVALDLRGGEVLDLVPGGGGNQARPQAAVDAINTLLAKVRDERAA